MSNAYESGARKLIPAVLIYVHAGDRYLLVHRNAKDRPGDYHAGKWNGLGGKLEADESPVAAARRELREESGLDLEESEFRLLGTMLYPNFKAHKSEDWLCYVYEAEVPAETIARQLSGPEGDLHWVEREKILSLPLWAGDVHFLPLVLRGRLFQGVIWYEGERVVRAEVSELG